MSATAKDDDDERGCCDDNGNSYPIPTTYLEVEIPGFVGANFSSPPLVEKAALKLIDESVSEADTLLSKTAKKGKEEKSCNYFIETQLGIEGGIEQIKKLLNNKEIFDISKRNVSRKGKGEDATNEAIQKDQKIIFYQGFFYETIGTGTTDQSSTVIGGGSDSPPQRERDITSRAQLLIHEALHLLKKGNSDIALAQKADPEGKKKFEDNIEGIADASEYLQSQIKKHCN